MRKTKITCDCCHGVLDGSWDSEGERVRVGNVQGEWHFCSIACLKEFLENFTPTRMRNSPSSSPALSPDSSAG